MSKLPGINIDLDESETNLVFFDVELKNRKNLVQALQSNGILGGSEEKRWRFVTHYGIEASDVDRTLEVMSDAIAALL